MGISERIRMVLFISGLVVGSVQGFVAHSSFLVAKMLTLVHRQTASTAAEAITFRTILTAVALFAEDITTMVA